MKTVILAGGSGSRLWPLSNDDTPKQLLSIDGKFTLLQNTFCRAQQFSAAADILTVTNIRFRDKTVAQLQEIAPGSPVLCEPCGRNTAPAIGCALKYLLNRDGDDVVAILPADHLIKDSENFCRTIQTAAELAESGFIVTLGIKPDYPETGFGYIKTSDALPGGFKVEKFVEKPSLTVAEEYVKSGNYFWNGGIFVGKISTFIAEFVRFAPEIAALADKCRFDNDVIDEDIFGQMPKISIDYAIMEKSGKIALVKLLSDWSDLGSFQAIYDTQPKDENGNVIIGKAILHNVRNCLIYSPERLSGVSDMENMVLVNTGNITMSCSLKSSQNVKILYEKLNN